MTLHELLAALRRAGWRHTRQWREGGRDFDGAPIDSGWIDHTWHRDVPGEDQREQIWLTHEWDLHPRPIGAVEYKHAEEDDFTGSTLLIGGDLIRAHGLDWLASLARMLGVLPYQPYAPHPVVEERCGVPHPDHPDARCHRQQYHAGHAATLDDRELTQLWLDSYTGQGDEAVAR